MKKYSTQTGLSLVELMVVMLIGLFILASMLQINLSSKKTYQITNYAAGLQDDMRTATADLTKIVRIAGYKSSPSKSTKNSFLADKVFKTNGQVVFGQDGAGTLDPDSFSIRFQGSGDGKGVADGMITDCNGDSLDADDIAVITFFIDTGALRCTSSNETQGNVPKTIDMVDNVENMQVLYGVDTDNDAYANLYVNADKAEKDGVWEKVVSLRIALLLKSNHEVYNLKNSKSITLNDITIPANNDRFMRMQSLATITLRNTLP